MISLQKERHYSLGADPSELEAGGARRLTIRTVLGVPVGASVRNMATADSLDHQISLREARRLARRSDSCLHPR